MLPFKQYENGKGRPKTILSTDLDAFPTSTLSTTHKIDYYERDLKSCLSNMKAVHPAGVGSGSNNKSQRHNNNINFNDFSKVFGIPEPITRQQRIENFILFREEAKKIAQQARKDTVQVDERRFRNFTSAAQEAYTPKYVPIGDSTIKATKMNDRRLVPTDVLYGDRDKIKATSSVTVSCFQPHDKKAYSDYKLITKRSQKTRILPKPEDSNFPSTDTTLAIIENQPPPSSSVNDNYLSMTRKSFPQYNPDPKAFANDRVDPQSTRSAVRLGEDTHKPNVEFEQESIFKSDYKPQSMKDVTPINPQKSNVNSESAFQWGINNGMTTNPSTHQNDFKTPNCSSGFDSNTNSNEATTSSSRVHAETIKQAYLQNLGSSVPKGDPKKFNVGSFTSTSQHYYKQPPNDLAIDYMKSRQQAIDRVKPVSNVYLGETNSQEDHEDHGNENQETSRYISSTKTSHHGNFSTSTLLQNKKNNYPRGVIKSNNNNNHHQTNNNNNNIESNQLPTTQHSNIYKILECEYNGNTKTMETQTTTNSHFKNPGFCKVEKIARPITASRKKVFPIIEKSFQVSFHNNYNNNNKKNGGSDDCGVGSIKSNNNNNKKEEKDFGGVGVCGDEDGVGGFWSLSNGSVYKLRSGIVNVTHPLDQRGKILDSRVSNVVLGEPGKFYGTRKTINI